MATTMTLACNVADMLIVTHIGDSRAYLYRAGKLHQLTRDHTVAQALVDQGVLQHTSQADERMRHTLFRLRRQRRALQCRHPGSLADQDLLVLCTDGLSDMLDNAGIAAILAHSASAPKRQRWWTPP